MKIKTDHGTPPIPDRRFDWSAIDDDTYDGENSPIGHGPTERDAVEDLMRMIFENDTESFIQNVTNTHMRILDRERAEVQLRQPPYRFLQHKLTDDETAMVNRLAMDELERRYKAMAKWMNERFIRDHLTDDEFDDDMFSQENGDGPIY